MSKLGVHVSAGNRRGFGEFLQAAAQAGNPVTVVLSVDQDVWPDVERFSPETVVIFRHQNTDPAVGGPDGPHDVYVGDPVQSARRWMAAQMPSWRQNRATYYAPLNEQDAPTLTGFEWLNTFTLECMSIAEANGFKLALYAFSAGNPKDLLDPVTHEVIATPEQCWHELIPSLQHAWRHGHILLLHEYGFGSPAANGGPETSLRASAPDLALRYRRAYRYLYPFDACPTLVIGESGAGVGGFGDLGEVEWLADAKWYDAELRRDRVVLGCCLYQVGGDENIKDALPELGQYIGATPNGEPEGDPVVGIEIDPPPPDPLTYDRTYYLLHASQYKAEWLYPALRPDRQWTAGSSAHDAFNTAPGLISRRVIAINPIRWGTAPTLAEWAAENFEAGYQLIEVTANSAVEVGAAVDAALGETPPPPQEELFAHGIDVSHWQGTIDWPHVPTEFAFIKCTEGTAFFDRNFNANWAGAKAEGVLRGAYHFFRFSYNAQAQADFCLSKLNGDYGDLPIVADVEDTNGTADAAKLKVFLDRIEDVTGRRPIIYTAAWWWNAARWGGTLPAWANQYDLWVANYTDADAPVMPQGWSAWKFWQYSNTGVVEGVPARVDLNWFNGTATELQQYADTIEIPPDPEPDQNFAGGVGAGNPQLLTERELEAFRISRLRGFKVLTLADPSQMAATIAAIRRVRPDAFILARLFYKADPSHFHRFSPAEFVATVTPGLATAYAAGVRHFEVHNEPNVPDEGMGWNWSGGPEFGAWLIEVLGLLRAKYPDAKWGYPGLSSNPAMNPLNFWAGSHLAALACDFICAHAYWQSVGSEGLGMTSIDGGWHWTRARAMFPGKPLYITEFSNNAAGVGYDAKGWQYAQYLDLLAREPGVAGAFAFALSWPRMDVNREAWVVNNVITQIPIELGAALALKRISAKLDGGL